MTVDIDLIPTNPSEMATPNLAQLKRAVSIAEQIVSLQSELASLVGDKESGSSGRVAPVVSPAKEKGKRTMSAAARAKISKAAKTRWAKVRKTSVAADKTAAVVTKRRRKLSPEGRASIVAAQKARWAAKKSAAAPTGKE